MPCWLFPIGCHWEPFLNNSLVVSFHIDVIIGVPVHKLRQDAFVLHSKTL